MKKAITCLVAVGLLGLGSTALASQDNTAETRLYVAPMATYSMLDDNSEQVGGQLSIGKNFGDYFALELYGFYFDGMGLDEGANINISGYGLSALFFPARDLLPVYALVGAGIGQYDFNGTSTGLDGENTQFYDLGLGYTYSLNDYGVKLRAEYRYRSTEIDMPGGPGDGDADANVLSLGIQVPLSAPAQSAPAPEPEPAPAPPPDSDGDGVIDRVDQCPATPRGVAVNASGCRVEKQTPVVLRGVTFEFDSAKLTAQAQRRLDSVIAALKVNNGIRFSIAGHTDAVGSDAYNQALSKRRAISVKRYLVAHGISPGRITAVIGYGESRPVATNETAAGRARNRRVELRVTQR